MSKSRLIILTLILILALGFLWFTTGSLKINKLPTDELGPILTCTKEAKICPDGSAVGRTGPNCEFGACPN